MSSAGQLEFEDEVVAIQREVDRLLRNNVTKIIALGHAGFNKDQKIAAEVRGIDLVVGGHTNTFLYTGAHLRWSQCLFFFGYYFLNYLIS